MKLRFSMTLADAQSASWLKVKERKRAPRVFLCLLGLAVLIPSGWLLFACGETHWGYAAFAVFCFLWEDVFFRLLVRLRVWHFFRRNQDLFREVELELLPDRLVVRVDADHSQTAWDKFAGYRIGKRNILLYLSRDVTVNIPTRIFADGQEQECLRFLEARGLRTR